MSDQEQPNQESSSALLEQCRGWFASRGLTPMVEEREVKVAVRGGQLRVPVHFSVVIATGDRPALRLRAVGEAWYAKQAWPRVLSSCNSWNRLPLVPTARLAPGQDERASVVLETWMPLVEELPGSLVEVQLELLVRSAMTFWRVAEGSEEEKSDPMEQTGA